MPTYPASVPEVEHPDNQKNKKPPKGILKNSNPNASYHKSSSKGKGSGMNKRIEDLIEYERPRSSPPQRHVCDEEDDIDVDETSSSSPSSPSSTATPEVSSRRHGHSKTTSSDQRHGHHHGHKSKHRSHRSSRLKKTENRWSTTQISSLLYSYLTSTVFFAKAVFIMLVLPQAAQLSIHF